MNETQLFSAKWVKENDIVIPAGVMSDEWLDLPTRVYLDHLKLLQLAQVLHPNGELPDEELEQLFSQERVAALREHGLLEPAPISPGFSRVANIHLIDIERERMEQVRQLLAWDEFSNPSNLVQIEAFSEDIEPTNELLKLNNQNVKLSVLGREGEPVAVEVTGKLVVNPEWFGQSKGEHEEG